MTQYKIEDEGNIEVVTHIEAQRILNWLKKGETIKITKIR